MRKGMVSSVGYLGEGPMRKHVVVPRKVRSRSQQPEEVHSTIPIRQNIYPSFVLHKGFETDTRTGAQYHQSLPFQMNSWVLNHQTLYCLKSQEQPGDGQEKDYLHLYQVRVSESYLYILVRQWFLFISFCAKRKKSWLSKI